MTPTFSIVSILGVGFFRATLFRVSCALHPDLPRDPCCRASFSFSHLDRACRSQFTRFHITCTVPPDPFLSDSCLAFVFCSGLPCSVFAPVSNVAPGVRMIYSQIIFLPPRTEFTPVGTRCAPSIRVISFALCLSPGTFFNHADLPAYL